MDKKHFWVSEIILSFFVVLLVLFGIFCNSILSIFSPITDPNKLDDNDVGRTFNFECTDNFISDDIRGFVLCYCDENGVGDYYLVRVPSDINRSFKEHCTKGYGSYKAVFRYGSDNEKDKAIYMLDKYYSALSDELDYIDYSENSELFNEVHESTSEYYIEVISINEEASLVPQLVGYILASILVIIILIRLIAFLSKKSVLRITLVFAGIILIAIAVIVAVLFTRIKSMSSIKQEGRGIYSMTSYSDLKMDELLEADISTSDELFNWIISEQLYGLPISVNEENFGCATFSCSNPQGEAIMGRNFDYSDTDTLVIYSNPKDGYASYALSDLTVLGVGEYGISPDSLLGRAYMLAAPYLCLDGINEEGLALGILELDIDELHQDNGKPDILIYCAIRAILDSCSNVDEAIHLLEQYDIHSAIGVSYHLQITDKSGRSVVVEWLDNKMYVNDMTEATNSVLTPGDHYDEGYPDSRIDILRETLNENNYILTEEEARDLLQSVSRRYFTEWSCIYNLERFEVTVYVDTDYERAYVFGG